MKKPAILFNTVFPLAFVEQTGVQKTAAPEGDTNWFLVSLIIVVSLILLIAFVFWLLKNSTLLEETFGKNEIEGRSWLKNHLNELDTDQLETLINLKSIRANRNLSDDNPDQK
ncbi:MAG: hypothetical protein ACTHJ8_07705 [Mucilaginibacter sp.]